MLVRNICEIASVYISPGYCDEKMTMFYADVVPGGKKGGDEGERISVVLMTADQVRCDITQGLIKDAKTLAAWAAFNERVKA